MLLWICLFHLQLFVPWMLSLGYSGTNGFSLERALSNELLEPLERATIFLYVGTSTPTDARERLVALVDPA